MYDYLIVGAGLYGAVFAQQAKAAGKKCLVIDKRDHIAGNIFCENTEGIHVHKYGAHIFHTSNKEVWKYVNQFVEFNNYINTPLANFQGKLFSLPFNMYTFYQLWGTATPDEAKAKIEEQRSKYKGIEPQNLEEQALSLAGDDIYRMLIKGYTEKQWGRNANELPAFIIRRLPFRFTYNNNYFRDPYQGIPIGGYNKLIEALLGDTEVRLNTDFNDQKEYFRSIAKKIIYTGEIDRFFDYRFGPLEYRSLRFDHKFMKGVSNYQGNAVINYTEKEIPFTRVIEHKHFEFGEQEDTVVTWEYPSDWKIGDEPYYPVNDEKNSLLFEKYKSLAQSDSQVVFGGRLGEYKYYDMDQVIASALKSAQNILENGQSE
ncbi:MAG: UDP-galactopyranose mutase [Bacteroidota bacterium]|nr:UDP-galactopyranose mutase [Bacteroidota bacterium]